MAKINKGGPRKIRGFGLRGMGTHKHGTCGYASKSPRFRHAMKREAEADVRRDRRSILEPKQWVRELREEQGR